MKKKILQKSTLCISLLMLVCTLLPQRAVGQPAVDFASAIVSSSISNGKDAVIRSVAGGSMAVASVNENLNALVYLIDPTSMMVYQAELPATFFIYDMRVNGPMVYFCGRHREKACIGYFKYNDLLAGPLLYFFYSDILFNDSINLSLHRMVAYTENSQEKVVAVGECTYMNYNSQSLICPDCSTPGDTVQCVTRLIVEADFPSGDIKYWTSEEADPFDRINEVVETDNFVSLIGMYTQNGGISIHRCKKSDVLGTYCADWYLYPVSTNEGASKIRGCRTQNDEIAIASLSPDMTIGGVSGNMVSIMREFNLATMDNFSSQLIMTRIKDEPKEMVYIPRLQSIILLHNIFYPSPAQSLYSFVLLMKNPPADYYAKSWIDINTNYYQSLDTASGNHFIAYGNDHCCLKDATMSNPSMCYKNELVDILIIDNAPKSQTIPLFSKPPINSPPLPTPVTITSSPLNTICF